MARSLIGVSAADALRPFLLVYNAAMTKLDEIAINIELVLISLIEGFALTNLAERAVPILDGPDAFLYLPYILSGLLIILVFWSQSILHAVSFIRWPLNMWHMFLYFVAAFVQVVAYSNLENLTMWFFWWVIFTVIGLCMYLLDYRIIRSVRSRFDAAYIESVERRHTYEIRVLVPAALIFNMAAFAIVFFVPSLFTTPLAFALPGILQAVVTLVALFDCVKNFNQRSAMIAGTQK